MQIYYSSPWIPAEWIKAHGLAPRGVWFAGDLWRGSLPLSAGVCAFAEAVVRFAEAHADAAMIFTTRCDQMRRSFDARAAVGRSRAFLFNLPATWHTPVARAIYRAEVERLGRFLQGMGGRAPSPQVLTREMMRCGQARGRVLQAALRCSSRQFASAIARFLWDGSVELPPHPAPPPADGVPLAVVGGPLTASQWGVLDVIESAGGRVVLNATEAGERSLWPAEPLEEPSDDPLGVLVGSYLENMTDVFQRPNTRLHSWLKQRLSPRGVRGIVLWHYTGCDLWRAEAQAMREAFGLPVLLLDADEVQSCSPRDVGRIQAFVETMR